MNDETRHSDPICAASVSRLGTRQGGGQNVLLRRGDTTLSISFDEGVFGLDITIEEP